MFFKKHWEVTDKNSICNNYFTVFTPDLCGTMDNWTLSKYAYNYYIHLIFKI